MKKFFLALGLFSILITSQAQRTIIHCGNLIDGKSEDVRTQVSIIIEGNRITSIQKGFIKATGEDKIIDLSRKTVLPGLIDMHVHLEGETNKDQNLQRFTLNEADIAFRSTVYAKKTLLAGFTTVRDLGGTGVNVSSPLLGQV